MNHQFLPSCLPSSLLPELTTEPDIRDYSVLTMADHTAASHSMDPEKDANIPELAQNNSNLPESSRFHEPDLEKGELPGSAPSPPLSYDEPKKNPDLVNWEGPHDPENPRNFSRMRKWYITMMLSLLTFCITFSSSVFSQATAVTAKIYGVSVEVTTLGTALIVLVGE